MGEERETKIFGLEPDQLGDLFSVGMGRRDVPDADTDDPASSPDEERSDSSCFAASLQSTVEQVGQWIGPYRLVRILGEGGMGVVYLAEQEHPIRRHVALKVIKPGMDSKRVVSRFQAERQALALLDHPNIAQVHDAGTTDGGRPYFVMEYVEGLPITDYCDEHKLTIEQRLRLFQHLCAAVQHAHQKGIIHRDLKPSNILIAVDGDKAIAKIIDFGVAKATRQPLTDRSLYTEDRLLLGTPEYMSPEQADVAETDIDTRSDIYSLGVLLYVLLTGVLPFDSETLRESGIEQIRKTIRETDPKTPSTRVTKLGDEATKIAQNRGVEVPALARRLRMELEWIPLKAMRKERAERYRSAAELADDIANYLNGRPLLAGPPAIAYRIRKYLYRHKALVGALMVAALSLLVGMIISTGLYLQAKRARAKAQAVADFLENDILAGLSSLSWNEATFQEVLDRAAEKLDTQFTDQPLVEASIRWHLGTMYSGMLGDYRKALAQSERAHQIYLTELGQPHDLNGLALRHARMGRYKEAEALFNARFETGHPLQADGTIWPDLSPSGYSFTYCNLAGLYIRQGRYEEAENLLRQVLAWAPWAPEDKWRLVYSGSLARAYHELGRYDEAERLYETILEAQRRVMGPENMDTAGSMAGLAQVHMSRGECDKANALLEKAVEAAKRHWGNHYPHTLRFVNQLAVLRTMQRDFDEAENLFAEALAGQEQKLGPDHPVTLETINDFGVLRREQRRYEEAESLLGQALDGRRRKLGVDHPACFESAHELAVLYVRQACYEDAEPLLLEAFHGREAKLGPEHPDTVESLGELVRLYEAWGKPDEAARWRARLSSP